MKDVKPLNVLAFTLLVLSIGIYATTQLMPTYAANPSTFFSCETGGGGCAVRLNTTSHIIVNATDTLYYPTNGTYTDGSGLNMTEGFVSFHQQRFRDFDVGGVHSVIFEDTNRDGEARLMLLGGTIATAQTTTLHFMPRFDNVSHIEIFSIFGNGTAYVLRSEQVGTGVLRPIIIQMDGNNIITFGIANTLDFNERVADGINIGGNDLKTTNVQIVEGISEFFNDAALIVQRNSGNNIGALQINPLGASTEAYIQIARVTGANDEVITLGSDNLAAGLFSLNVEASGGGTIRPFRIAMNSSPMIDFAAALTMNFNSRAISSLTLGSAMNANTQGIFGLDYVRGRSIAGADFNIYTGFGSTTADLNLLTKNGADADTLRLEISGGVATASITMNNANFAVPTNNTLSMFSDAIRVANIFSVVNTAKSQVTGLLLESDISPAVGESFTEGDIVCLYKPFSFTKCTLEGDILVLGPVHFLQERGIIGYENETRYRMVEQTEFYAKNITDADGNIILTRAERIVKEIFRDKQTFTLDNGSKIQRDVKAYRSIWINESYIESVPIWGNINEKPLLVIEGPLKVKACGTILKGQFLIAGAGGCAKGVFTLDNDTRYFGIAAANSRGGYVEAYMP